MKFLRIILIGSLTVSAALPCNGFSRESFVQLIHWVKKNQKAVLLAYSAIAWGIVLYISKNKLHKKVFSKVDRIRAVLETPREGDVRAQEAREKQQLRDVIASGYRLTTDKYFLQSDRFDFLKYVIDNKPYLITLLKELGLFPVEPFIAHNPNNVFWPPAFNVWWTAFERALEKDSPLAFNALLECFPLSEAEWDALINNAVLIDHRKWRNSSSKNSLDNISHVIPAELVNKTYPFYQNNVESGQQTLLHYWVKEAFSPSLFPSMSLSQRDRSCIQELINKGADPLIPDTDGKTILDLLSSNLNDSDEKRNLKKEIYDIIMPAVKGKKEARKKAIHDVVNEFSPALTALCSDYEYNTDGNRLLDLLASEENEREILSKLDSVMQSQDTYEQSAGTGYLVNKANAQGMTPLMYAATRGHCSVVQYLMDHGADYEACDKKGCNVLRHAAYHGQSSVIKTVLEQAKKDGKLTPRLIDKQDNYWHETPLINAIRTTSSPKKVTAKMREDTVRVLLEYGADTTLESINHNAEYYAHGGMMEDEHGVADTRARPRIIAMLQNPPRLATDIPPAASPGLSLDVSS